MLCTQDVGQRVVVRRVIGTRAGRPLLTDAFGILISINDATLTLATKAGPLTISRDRVVAAKRVPPPPPPRHSPPTSPS